MDPRSSVTAGQKLRVAASQINWLNRQMRGPSGPSAVESQAAAWRGAVVVPCSVSTSIDDILPGHVVRITSAGSAIAPDLADSEDHKTARVFSVSGSVVVPCSFDNYDESSHHLGVIVGGTTMPKQGAPKIVSVAISGMCVARVRWRNVGAFIRGPVTRQEDEDPDLWTGCAEQSSCGPHRLVAPLAMIDNDEELQWCVVLL